MTADEEEPEKLVERRWPLRYQLPTGEATLSVVLTITRHDDDTMRLTIDGLERDDLYTLFTEVFADTIYLILREDDVDG